MKQGLCLNEWISVESQSTEISLKLDREEVFLIVSLKTVVENLNQLKSYNKTNPTVFILSLWEKIQAGLNFFWPASIVKKVGVSEK